MAKIEKAREGFEEIVQMFDKLFGEVDEQEAREIEAVKQKYAGRKEMYIAERSRYVEEQEVEENDDFNLGDKVAETDEPITCEEADLQLQINKEEGV